MKKLCLVIAAALAAGPACAAVSLGDVYKVKLDTEEKIQFQVINPLLGYGKASVFLEVEAGLKISMDEKSKSGAGRMSTQKDSVKDKDGEKTQKQTASQENKSADREQVFSLELRGMKLRILHDRSVAAEKIKAVKEALLAVYPGKIKAEDIIFVPAAFEKVQEGD